MKDVSIRISGRDRQHLDEIKKTVPVKQVVIIGAALSRFRKLPTEEQWREVTSRLADTVSPRRNKNVTSAMA